MLLLLVVASFWFFANRFVGADVFSLGILLEYPQQREAHSAIAQRGD